MHSPKGRASKKKLLMIYCIPFKPSFHNWFISSPSAVLRLLIKNLTHPAVHLPDNLANDEGADNIKKPDQTDEGETCAYLRCEGWEWFNHWYWHVGKIFEFKKKLKILTFYYQQRRLLIEAVIIVYHCYVSCIHKALNEINLSTFTS